MVEKIKVLVVDDAAFMVKALTEMLASDPQIEVIGSAKNGRDALDKIKKLSPDVITLDVDMPVMDGISAAKFIRNIESQKGMPHLPIAFFSSVKADDNLREALMELSPANYVNKASDPDPDKLVERVEQLLLFFKQLR